MLGTIRRWPPRTIVVGRLGDGGQRHGEFVAKPYHYGPLIRKIEKLLDADRRENPRAKI